MGDNKQQASWQPLIVIALSMVMMYITSFSVNVLITEIVTDLKTSVANLQFVIVAASLIAGSLMVTAGRLGDKFGKKKIFILGIIIYIVGLITVVLSPNITIFTVAWAIIWPLGMVLIVPTSIAMIMYYYDGSQRAKAFGIYGAVLSAVSAIAPVVVGFLANELGWRIALSLSPAVGVLTLLFAFTLVETDKDSTIKIDLPSVILSVLGFGTFLITSTLAGQYGWLFQKRPLVLGGEEIGLFGLSVVPFLYLLSIVLLIAFFHRGRQLHERSEMPLLDGSLLKNIPFTLGMSVQALLYMAIAGVLFAVSVFLQAGVRFDSLQTALTILPFSILVAAFSFLTPGLGKRIAPKWIISTGCLVMVAGIWMTGNDASMQMSPMDLLPAMVLLGAGGGLIMAQIATVTMSTVPPEHGGAASGVSETAKEIIGQGFAIALAGSVLFGAVYASMADDYARLEGISLSDAEHQQIVVELEDIFQEINEKEEEAFVSSLPPKTRAGYPQIVNDAAERGLKTALMVMNIAVAIMLLLSLLLPSAKVHAPELPDDSAAAVISEEGKMQATNLHHTNSESSGTSWKYRLGLVLFFGAFPVFFATPIVIPMLGLSAGESAAMIGGILLAVEVFWFASIPLLGKEGFNEVKQRTFGWLKLSSSPVSRARHRFGVVLLFGSILLDVLLNLILVATDFLVQGGNVWTPEVLGISFRVQATVFISVQILTTIGIVVSVFILGENFWERLKQAFEWQASEQSLE